ncbi:MAG TPA: hypothetical protein VGI39_45050 [Polyangiaceae bacterium]
MAPPLLSARDLRIDEHGVASVDGLTLATHAKRVVLVGAGRALFEAACGVLKPARGSLEVQGMPAAEALAMGNVAGAPRDPPLPADWTPLAYATWSARLTGLGSAEAGARAAGALEKVGVRSEGRALLRGATLALRRATVLAAALATGARVILLEDPSPSLDDEAAAIMLAAFVRALEGQAWALFAPRAPLTSPLIAAAEEALVFAGSSVVEQGAPSALAAKARRYAVDAQGDGQALAAKVAARGFVVEPVFTAPGCARFVVELPPGGSTRDLFACAEEAGAIVVELRPIARAFA